MTDPVEAVFHPAEEAVHAVHKLDDDGMTTSCGLTWLRWSEPKIEATAQWADVSCRDCLRARDGFGSIYTWHKHAT